MLTAIEADATITNEEVLHFAVVNILLSTDHLNTTANTPRIKYPYIFLFLLLSGKY